MDVLDKFFTKYSYKFPKGYPDLKDKQDILLMESILEELGLRVRVDEADNSEEVSQGIEILKKELNLTDEYFPIKGEEGKTKSVKILVKRKERGEFNDKVDSIEGFEKSKNNVFKFKSTKFEIKPLENNPIIVDGEVTSLNTDANIKEGLVVVFYEVLKEGLLIEPFFKDEDVTLAQLELIPSQPMKAVDDAIGEGVSGKVNDWLNNVRKNPTDKKALEELNNAYSIGKMLANAYPSSKAIRDEKFNKIRTAALNITGLPQDKWNPGDIYLYHGGDLDIEDAIEQGAIGPVNNLFNDEWGVTDNPLTAISLKKEDYQPGRASAYLEQNFKDESKFKKSQEKDIEKLSKELEELRTEARSLEGKYGDIKVNWSLIKQDSTLSLSQLQSKIAALQYFNYLLKLDPNDPLINFLGIFAFGEGLNQQGKVNPTFFKLIGTNKGGDATRKKYFRGATVQFNPGSTIKIQDSNGSGNIEMFADLLLQKGDESRVESTRKTFRTSGTGNVGII